MVGTSPPPGLCSFSTQRRCSVDVKTITELRISAIKQDQRGWMSENYLFLQRREKCFLLTSPFIEPGSRLSQELALRVLGGKCDPSGAMESTAAAHGQSEPVKNSARRWTRFLIWGGATLLVLSVAASMYAV